MTRYRWRICALLFLATTLNYVDRAVFGTLAPELRKIVGWNDVQYGNLVAVFQWAYAIGLLVAGGVIDRIGPRLGYTLSIGVWSLATMGHVLARTVAGFGIARGFLGIGEAGSFPAAIKTVAEWFPKRERALATGIFNSGTNVGATIAPIFVPWIFDHYGWQPVFLLMGSVSALWIIPWLIMYRAPERHPSLSKAELVYIQSDPSEPVTKVAWLPLMGHRQTWAFAIGKFMTDPVWWFLLFWLPPFLNTQYGLTIGARGLPLVIIYNAATVGSIAGGWLPARFLKMGWSVNRARKTAMLICALCITPIVFAARAQNLWVAVGLISIAVACHQGWSANIFTLPSDMFPKRAVGSVVGMGGFAGALGGALFAQLAGNILQVTHSYFVMFAIAASVYLIALGIIHALVPRMEPAKVPVQ